MSAYVIAVCGAGGKSTYIKRKAEEYASKGKRVVVTTTTHIFNEKKYSEYENIILAGEPVDDSKLGPLSESDYMRLCDTSDIVLVEADGSRRMPIKIPAGYEPVIPENADETVVVMGAHALGRKLRTVCHRAELLPERYSGEETVDEELIRDIAKEYYLSPLREKYPKKKLSLFISDMRKDFLESVAEGKDRIKKINMVLLASGFGRRFGKNKLLEIYKGKPLFLNTLDNIIEAVKLLEKSFSSETWEGAEPLCEFSLTVVTRYEEILYYNYDKRYGRGRVKTVYNPDFEEGIAGSVRMGARVSIENKAEAVAYFVADQPELGSFTIADFISDYIYSGKSMAAMYTDGHMSNPGVLSADHFDEILKLEGDRGCMGIIKKNPESTFIYQVEAEKLKDVDIREDIVR